MGIWMAWANEAILFSDTGLGREALHEKPCLVACYRGQFPTDPCNDLVLV